MKAIIFANGDFDSADTSRYLLDEANIVIAANGGTHHALEADITPTVVIGDGDSLDADTRQQVEAAGGTFVSYPARKDETDLELALLYAADQGCDEIVILGALGGRLDQMLANVFLLTRPEVIDRDVHVLDGRQDAFVIHREGCIEGEPGDTVSLLPIGGDAVGITVEGLEWPLDDDTLPFGRARGVSNVLHARSCHISVRKGLLLCIITAGGVS